jgi:hypothetical protein
VSTEAALAKALKVIVRNASIDMGIKSTMGTGKKDLQRRTKNGYEGGKVVTWDASAIYVKSEIQRFKDSKDNCIFDTRSLTTERESKSRGRGQWVEVKAGF